MGLVLALSAGLALSSCASSPKEKTDELDGTDWFYQHTSGFYEGKSDYFRFRHGGKFRYEGTDGNYDGTYTVDGDKIITVNNVALGDKSYTFTLSEDRKTFSDRRRRVYKRGATWGEIFGKKKKEGDA